MLAQFISRCVVVVFGVLLPGYRSYKALKRRDSKEHIKWMMHWVVFAAFYTFEILSDYILCWLPFYYEMKMAFIIWLILPITRGSSVLYRRIIHPLLEKNEKEIDEAITKASESGYVALTTYGAKGLNLAATTVVSTVIRGQGILAEQLKRRSYSMGDIFTPDQPPLPPLEDQTSSLQQTGQHAATRRHAYERTQSDASEDTTRKRSSISSHDPYKFRISKDLPGNLYRVNEEPQVELSSQKVEKVIYVPRSNLGQSYIHKVTSTSSSPGNVPPK